ncbi:MAG: PDZ domain-containing protein [Pirellulales bacterium]
MKRSDHTVTWRARIILTGAILATPFHPDTTAAADDLYSLEADAVRQAVERVAPSIVQIHTVGGAAHIGKQQVGNGPTSGLIVSSDGYVMSSAFGFAHKPTSILVTLNNDQQLAAERVATDRSRMLVLLKVETDQMLSVPEVAPETAWQVGAWAIAVGRTFSRDAPNLSVGIISARNRIFGRVVQTDAKLSPANYGGALVDIEGRVIGIPVPMSPQGDDELAGVEWYDSGIGFAVPLDHVLKILPRLQTGRDLLPGVLGVSLKRGNPFVLPAEIAVVQPNSPARAADLKSGDRLVQVDGHDVSSQIQLRARLRRYYAGDTVRLVLLRGDERIEKAIELADRIVPFEHAFFGILPLRTAGDEQGSGVTIRFVYPDSPAARAGLKAGDRIVRLAGEAVDDREAAVGVVNRLTAGDPLTIDVDRTGEPFQRTIETVGLPEDLPAELPPSHTDFGEPPAERPAVGSSRLDLADRQEVAQLYVPKMYNPRVQYGLVVWFRAPSQGKEAEAPLALWQPVCDERELILLAPEPAKGGRWRSEDVRDVRKMIDLVARRYSLDPARIVVHGYQSGGTMAYLVALTNRQRVHGVVVVDATLPRSARVPANDPVLRLAVVAARAAKSRRYEAIAANIKALRQAEYPVTLIDLGDDSRYLNADEISSLGRWIDALDRL